MSGWVGEKLLRALPVAEGIMRRGRVESQLGVESMAEESSAHEFPEIFESKLKVTISQSVSMIQCRNIIKL